MYRMRQREFIAALVGRRAGPARGARRSRHAAPRDGVCRAHAYAAGAADDGRALPARRDRAARTRRTVACAPRLRPPTRVRSAPARSPARASRSIVSSRAICLDSTSRPAIRTAASPRSTTCSRACRAAQVMLVGTWPCRPGPAAVVHPRVRLPAACRRPRAGEQHHAAEAQPRCARARAFDRQQGARRSRGHRHRRPQHAVRRHRRYRGRPAAAGRIDVPRRASEPSRWSPSRFAARSSTWSD